MEYYKTKRTTLLQGDCLELLKDIESESIDAIITDPPYSSIKRDYGNLNEDDWFALMNSVISESKRILKPTGSAVFILQPNSEKIGRMRPWLFRFIYEQCRDWNLIQDVWWWNFTTMPAAGATNGGLLRGSLKACVWLGEPDCYRDQSKVLWEESEANRALRQSARLTNDRKHFPSGHSANRKRMADAVDRRGGVTPFNVLPMPNSNSTNGGGAYGHGASTPQPLADWWTRYICPDGGTCLDMFCGSGTMGMAAIYQGCNFIGIEGMAEYAELSKKRLRIAERETVDFY